MLSAVTLTWKEIFTPVLLDTALNNASCSIASSCAPMKAQHIDTMNKKENKKAKARRKAESRGWTARGMCWASECRRDSWREERLISSNNLNVIDILGYRSDNNTWKIVGLVLILGTILIGISSRVTYNKDWLDSGYSSPEVSITVKGLKLCKQVREWKILKNSCQ